MRTIKLTLNVPEPALVAAVELLLRGVRSDAAPEPPAPAPAVPKATGAPTKRMAKRHKLSKKKKPAKRRPGIPKGATSRPAVPPAPDKGPGPDADRLSGEQVAALLKRLDDAGVTRAQLAGEMSRSTHALGLLAAKSRMVSVKNAEALRAAVTALGCQDLW